MGNTEWKPEGMIQPLWATPIYQNQAKNKEFDEIQEELKTVTSKLKFNEAQGWGPYAHDLSENPFESNFLIDNKCIKTVEFIHRCLSPCHGVAFHHSPLANQFASGGPVL